MKSKISFVCKGSPPGLVALIRGYFLRHSYEEIVVEEALRFRRLSFEGLRLEHQVCIRLAGKGSGSLVHAAIEVLNKEGQPPNTLEAVFFLDFLKHFNRCILTGRQDGLWKPSFSLVLKAYCQKYQLILAPVGMIAIIVAIVMMGFESYLLVSTIVAIGLLLYSISKYWTKPYYFKL